MDQRADPTIDVALVRRLVASQLPQWAASAVTPMVPDGWDNRTFRLGDELIVRLPSGAGYAPQVEKEHRWLPVLGPHLPQPVPVPVAKGLPGQRYPYSWSVYRWLEGLPARPDRIDDERRFGKDLARFLLALQRIDPTGGPGPARHGGFRGGPLLTYDTETRRAITGLESQIDARAAVQVWDAALRAGWDGPPVWFHGDVAAGHLLVRGGRLAGVIDFGCCGVGDPACDLTVAWTVLAGAGRCWAGGIPRRARSRRADVGPRSRLGVVEGAHHLGAGLRQRSC